jgi:hypothetical protein
VMPRAHRSILALLVCAACTSAHAQIDLRLDRTGATHAPSATTSVTIDALPASMDAAGVHVTRDGVKLLIGWDRIKQIRGDIGGSAGTKAVEQAATFATLADSAFRARTRLERGDFAAAEPLLEDLFGTGGLNGPTGAVICEGLLRCRLRRGAQASAIWPLLERQRIESERAGANAAKWIGGIMDAAPAIDPVTGLAPGLAPIWLREPALESLAGDPKWSEFESQGAGDAATIARWYRASAAFECGLPGSWPTRDTEASNDAVRLVQDVVSSRIGAGAERAAARASLQARIEQAESGSMNSTWVEAWCRAAVGRSLVHETDTESIMRGAIELLHVPARFGAEHPYLSGVALAEASGALWRLGDQSGAVTLRDELSRRYPGHPALRWDGLQNIDSPPPSSASPSPREAPAAPGAGGAMPDSPVPGKGAP